MPHARAASTRAGLRPGPPAAREPAAPGPAGLAHVAAVSFLAARAAPSGGFWISLAGGVALARGGERLGARRGFGASLAAMLQSVAMIGPARLGVPLTQAVSAPLLGRMAARGRGRLAQILACAAIRTIHNGLGTAFFIGVVTGLDAYAASYDRVVGGLLSLPKGEGAALAATAAGLLAWSGFASTLQVAVYRRGLASWSGGQEAPDRAAARQAVEATRAAEEAALTGASAGPRFDARGVALAAAIAFGLLLASTEWALLAAVAAWLAAAGLTAARADRDVLPAGLVLAAVLAASALLFGVVGGLGLEVSLQRAGRAGLLVLVATWLRAAAGSEGLREVARRGLWRLRAVPSIAEARAALDELGPTPRLAAAGRALFGALRPVRKRPVPVVDAVLGWVRLEAARFRPAEAALPVELRLRARDAGLVVLAALPALTLFPSLS